MQNDSETEPGATERMVTLIGNKKATDMAYDLIKEVIDEVKLLSRPFWVNTAVFVMDHVDVFAHDGDFCIRFCLRGQIFQFLLSVQYVIYVGDLYRHARLLGLDKTACSDKLSLYCLDCACGEALRMIVLAMYLYALSSNSDSSLVIEGVFAPPGAS